MVTSPYLRRFPKISLKLLLTLIIGVIALIWIYPIVLTVITSLKTDTDFLHSPLALPAHPSLDAYKQVFGYINFGLMLQNSLIYSVGGTALALLLAIFPAYVLGRLNIPGGNFVFILLLTGLMIPQQSVVIGLYEQLECLHMLDKWWGLVIVHGVYGLPYVMLILRGYVVGIPKEIEMAGRVDGCSDFGVLRYIIFPNLLPGIIVAGVFNIISIWNELFFALIFLSSQEIYPVSVGLNFLKQGKYFVSWNLPTASAIAAQIPIVILYIVAYRYIKDGLFSGAVKG